MPEAKKATDWEAVERDYRAGVLTFDEMAQKHGISKGRISQVAKKKAWTRDLSAKIAQKAEEKLNKALLNDLNENAKQNDPAKQIADEAVVEASAQAIANVVLGHRKQIKTARDLVDSLMAELVHQTGNRDLYQQLGELMASPDDKGVDKLAEAYQKVISLAGRIGNLKSLGETMKNLVGLERQAFNVDGHRSEENPKDEESAPALEVARRLLFVLNAGIAAKENANG